MADMDRAKARAQEWIERRYQAGDAIGSEVPIDMAGALIDAEEGMRDANTRIKALEAVLGALVDKFPPTQNGESFTIRDANGSQRLVSVATARAIRRARKVIGRS